MTALNWTKDRARRLTREISYDDLPPCGSWADQKRYGGTLTKKYEYQPRPQPTSALVTHDRSHDFSQLQIYISHALHPDFKRKVAKQREDVINIIRKLSNRCQYWQNTFNKNEKAVFDKALVFLRAQAH